MWQFLIVAAVAGSTGFFAKHLRSGVTKRRRGQKHLEEEVLSGSDQTEISDSVETQISNTTALLVKEAGIFRFSSPEAGTGSRNLRKRNCGRSRKGVGSEQKLGSFCGGAEQRKGSRRFGVCLKRRRTNKRESGPSEGGSSLFGWGVGVGMMYMMSAGKSEISKLNITMDETARALEELKAEFKRRESHIERFASKTKSKKCSSDHTPLEPNELGVENRKPDDDIKLTSLSSVDDGECPSSVLTEEQEPELLEMDQLEAEFVSELQKLPWCNTEASQPDGVGQNLTEFDAVNDMENQTEHQVFDPYQFQGVKPSELDNKLSHLLIAQQENQILELESELQTAQSKLNGKEAELRALKDCVRRLTEISLSTITDDETEAHDADILDYNMTGSESKRSIVGMKRSIDSKLCGY